MVCVDLGYEPMKPTWRTMPALMRRLSLLIDREVHLVIGSSQNTTTYEIVSALGPFDLIFIDGGHKLHEVASDWGMYGPLGKIVAFHDIASCKDVKFFWNRLKNDFPRHAEFIDNEAAGIGVISDADWKQYLTRSADAARGGNPRTSVLAHVGGFTPQDSTLFAWAVTSGTPMAGAAITLRPWYSGATALRGRMDAADRWMQATPPAKPGKYPVSPLW